VRTSESESRMQLKHLLLCVLAIACGAPDETQLEDHVGWTYIDGPIESYENAPNIPAFQDPDWVEGDYGQTTQAWVSKKYHGDASGFTCYGPSSQGLVCKFPPYKQINVTTPNWSADTSNSNCATQRSNLAFYGGTQAEFDLIKDAYVAGMASLNAIGTNVVVKINNTSGTKMSIPIRCENTYPALGIFAERSTPNQVHVQLPAFQGVDPAYARQYIASGSNVSSHGVDIVTIWDFVTRPNSPGIEGCGLAPGNARNLKLAEVATQVGKHEGLHMFGFGHFAEGIMSTIECTVGNHGWNGHHVLDTVVPPGFGEALSAFNGSASGGVNISVNATDPLDSWGPL
jgi:hypothetical protein